MATISDEQIIRVGSEIFEKMKGKSPSVFNKDWWSGKVMDWSMKDENFKIEMFRFVDVFPALRTPVEVAEHLQEYFCRPEQNFPASFQWGLGKVKPNSIVAKIAAKQIEKQMKGMAKKFIAGSDAKEALKALKKCWKQDLAFTLDLLGEATLSENEADDYFDRYEEIIDTLVSDVMDWKKKPQLESAPWGVVPRVNVSIKVSALFSQIDPIDPGGSIDAIKDRLRPLLRKAKEKNAFVNLDMEQHDYKDLTIALFKSILSEPEFNDFPNAGIAIQAYLRDTLDDLKSLCAWAKERGTPVSVRLIKGAYWDFETIHSNQEGWSSPVWGEKWETDANFEACTELLLDNHQHIRLAIGSHNVRSIAHAIAYSQKYELPQSNLEFQMLYGMAEPIKLAMSDMGYRVREYVPIGKMIPGMAYLVRRLLENTSNESWLRHSYADGYSMEKLLAAPAPEEGQSLTTGDEHLNPLNEAGFRNWPLLDFANAKERQRFDDALSNITTRNVSIILDGERIQSAQKIPSIDPSEGGVLGEFFVADLKTAEKAVQVALSKKARWSATPVGERTGYVRKLAELMDQRRYEIAAWMVKEVGKNWREADGDLCEAIDFCLFYADEMERLSKPQQMGNVLGELNQLFYTSRGVAAIISPWNFPFAILTGMAIAAAVCGNTVIMKPAEQSTIVASLLMELIEAAGFPSCVFSFLPGLGEEVGAFLVDHKDVDLIAFTGSMRVGLDILEKCGRVRVGQKNVKKVVCEMGGKNAIIVDADSDLDEAVKGVLKSAFGFQGQKCSACSRVIVVGSAYEEFKKRLLEGTKSLTIGAASDPANLIGPVIDTESKAKILSYIEIGKSEGSLLIQRKVGDEGTFVGPTIIENITKDHRLAQEEIFGPVLALMRAQTFTEALDIANGTPFALTGGVYSRSPLNIQAAYAGFNVGNLYINRSCTGALVYRQPFGGFKMSGTGTKAGGPDYLLNFLEARAVTENTMRRGFAPEL